MYHVSVVRGQYPPDVNTPREHSVSDSSRGRIVQVSKKGTGDGTAGSLTVKSETFNLAKDFLYLKKSNLV